jgi:hypothetical protein
MGKVRLRDLDPAIFLNKVGIGTDSPAEMLDVVGGNVRIGKTTNGRLIIENSSGTVKVQLDSNGTSYFNGGSVGINDTSPSPAKFSIVQDSATDPVLRIEDAGVASYDFTFPDAYKVKFATNTTSTKTFIFNNEGTGGMDVCLKGGSLGIGIETAPTANLQIHQETVPGGQRMLDISTKEGNIFSVCNEHQNRDGCYLRSEGSMFLGTNADIDTVHIDGGKVGVGTGSDTPTYKFTVQDASPIMALRHTSATNQTSAAGYIVWTDANNSQLAYVGYGTNTDSLLRLVNGTGGITVSTAGNVGIGTGTDTPKAALHVVGGIHMNNGFALSWDQADGTLRNAIRVDSGDDLHIGDTNFDDIRFSTGQKTDCVIIKQTTGNVRMGATDGDSKLNVGGDICLLADNSTDRRDGITERVVHCNNEAGASGVDFNLADITRDTSNWGGSHYIVEIFASQPTGGCYAKYFVYYAYSSSGVMTLETPKGVNTTGYGVRLSGEQTISGNIKRASIMVDLPAYGRASVKLTHVGVYTVGEWDSSNENLAGRIKYNL